MSLSEYEVFDVSTSKPTTAPKFLIVAKEADGRTVAEDTSDALWHAQRIAECWRGHWPVVEISEAE